MGRRESKSKGVRSKSNWTGLDDAPCSVARGMNERRREEDEALERQREEVDSVLAIFEGDEKIRIETSGGGSDSSSKLPVCVHARFQVESEKTEKTKTKA